MTQIWEKIIQKRSKNVLFPSKTLENEFSALRRSRELRFGHDRGRGRSSNILGLTLCYRYDFMILYATGTISDTAVRKNWELRFGHDRPGEVILMYLERWTTGASHPGKRSRWKSLMTLMKLQLLSMKLTGTKLHLSLSDQFRGWIWNLQIPFILIRTLPVPYG